MTTSFCAGAATNGVNGSTHGADSTDASSQGAAARLPRGAAAMSDDEGTLTPHEKSMESEMADEGLDLSHISQTREMSLFAGPYLNYSEEETVLG